jgi:two-component system, cell cycle sensor histidine kinase and response regulator CckA
VEPWAGNEAAMGFDLGSEPRRLQAMERSLRTGLETVSEQIPLNGILDRQGMVCLRPVFKNGAPTVDKEPGRLLGFALGVLQPQALLERVFKGYETGKSPVAVHLVDLMGGREPELLAVHPQEHLLHHPSVVNEIYLQHYPLHQVLPIFLFGRGFAIVSHPTEAFFAVHPIRAGWLAGSLGFFVTGVLTVLVGFLRSRQGSLERQVAHRTAELQESRQRIETLLEVTKTGVNVIDDRFNLLYVDPGLQKLYGDPGGRKCHEYFMALEGPCVWCAAETSLRTRAIQVVEQTLPRENHRPVEVHTVPFRNSSGQWMVAELKVDITERKRALEELRRLAEAMGQTSEAIVITTPKGVIEYVNPAFEQITGFSQEEAVGETPRILKSGSHDEAFYKKFWSTLLSGDRWTGRIVNRRKDGVPYTAECSISPVRNERGDLAHFVWVSRDITRELALEERFRQSERLESVGRLAAGVAHDMNNLLTPILGYGEILLMDLDPSSESYRQAQVIRESAERSRDLIRQLLAFGRKQVLEVTATDLRRLVRDMEKLMRRTIRENIALEIRTDGPCPIMSDAGQMGQVLMNLAVNAQDAMPQGGDLIMEVSPVQLDESCCQTHGGLKPGKYAMLSVSDTGVGMDQETLRLIFEPFFTTKKELGTGLGLATVYGIVKQHDGHISVYSEPDRGTVFKVYLPLIQEADLSPQLKRPAMELRGSETILVVEDNELPRNLACRILERQGYTALSAAGGREALELLETHPDTPVHLLLTDVVMPNMDGKSLSRQLCSKYSDLKVLYMSGYTQEVIDRHGILEEGVHFIQKPFSVASLSEKVRQVLDSSVS